MDVRKPKIITPRKVFVLVDGARGDLIRFFEDFTCRRLIYDSVMAQPLQVWHCILCIKCTTLVVRVVDKNLHAQKKNMRLSQTHIHI